jgi:hypothetical protein
MLVDDPLASSANVVERYDLKISQALPPDWRGRFSEAYRRELQSWVDAIVRWRSGRAGNAQGPVGGPDAWDGYRTAVISQTVLASMAEGGLSTVASMPLPDFYRRVALRRQTPAKFDELCTFYKMHRKACKRSSRRSFRISFRRKSKLKSGRQNET